MNKRIKIIPDSPSEWGYNTARFVDYKTKKSKMNLSISVKIFDLK